ncbi:MAG: Dyp-type peroxidase [Solirubrobacterales bacterium]|nr:Dyp-type peroxidase [Solirubrobacterales bacterium]MBV9047487.1 Dyp-type peroxidase [Solirubrobacterales bacterium]
MRPLDRRSFLSRSLTVIGAGGVGAAAGASVAESAQATPPSPSPAVEAQRVNERALATSVAFDGAHQAGILSPRQDQATFLALDSVAPSQAALFEALQALSTEARLLTQGESVGVAPIDDPPPDSGILGALDSPDTLTVTIGFGASLFDSRYGLGHLRPRRLDPMPAFPNDQLQPARTGGDVIMQISAGQRDTVLHTVRELLRVLAGRMVVRWTLDGFLGAQRGPTPESSRRNMFAFRDGSANPDAGDPALMDQLVWVQPRSDEPSWAAGGTYFIVRTIRMHVEFWDRVGMLEQQRMVGRDRVTGAPLGGTSEFQDPRYDLDPRGARIPLSAHIRLANPRTSATANQRILRRSYNYHRGVDEGGNLDQGLVFVAFNQDPERQFATIQQRLEAEPMTDYITPVGGGYFFAPPGASGSGDWVGSGLA